MRLRYNCCCGEMLEVEDDQFAETTEKVSQVFNEFKVRHEDCLSKNWEERTSYRGSSLTPTDKEAPF